MLTSKSIDLRALRTRLGIGQSELAKASGFSRQAIYLIERGLRKPTGATMKALSGAIEVLHLSKAQIFIAKGAPELADAESDEAGRTLLSMSVEELLGIKVRVIPYQVEVNQLGQRVATPMGARRQLLDGLQALAIYRLFRGLFKLEILPGWWTLHDDYRTTWLWREHRELTFEEVQQKVIEEGPKE